MTTLAFWTAVAERSLKTFAQTLGALLGAGTFGLLDAPWQASVSAAAMAAVLSVLTSVGSSTTGEPGPSLGQETVT